MSSIAIPMGVPQLYTTVPNHAGRDLARPLIREILREIELSPERFGEELRQL